MIEGRRVVVVVITDGRALAQFRSHLDTLYKRQSAPLAANYDHYLTAEEPFLVEK